MLGDLDSVLSKLCLSRNEARVYLALLSNGVATTKELSNLTEIPYSKIYEYVEALLKKGVVMTHPTRPLKVRPISPMEAFRAVKKKHARELRRAEKEIAHLEDLFLHAKLSKREDAGFWLLHGRTSVNERTGEILSGARKSIRVVASANSIRRLYSCHAALLKEANVRGVTRELILCGEDLPDSAVLGQFDDVRYAGGISGYIVTVDGTECLLYEPIPDDESDYGRDIGLLISRSPFVKLIERMFTKYFEAIEPKVDHKDLVATRDRRLIVRKIS